MVLMLMFMAFPAPGLAWSILTFSILTIRVSLLTLSKNSATL